MELSSPALSLPTLGHLPDESFMTIGKIDYFFLKSCEMHTRFGVALIHEPLKIKKC